MHEVDAILCGPRAGRRLLNPLGGAAAFKVSAAETRGAVTAFESVVAPGEGPPLHVHPAHDETIYVLEGTLRFRLGDELEAAPAGSFAFIPRRTVHTWQNDQGAEARLFVSFIPGAPGMEAFFAGVADAARAAPPEIFRTVSSGGEMEIVGPPLAESHPL